MFMAIKSHIVLREILLDLTCN